ncbi:hypothetical protein [Plasmodium yoelii yoelii]|uniref:Uncharacterized protein n=1 Tax=Plasmodium yoelii yoelii TaxID=73239 RepID=Q7RES8_PLAYO|nr:hypothetical protein [Plasmodium yoelii yoelii]
MEKQKTKKIKLNVTREEDNLQSNIYYVCEKNIIISQLNITINYDENNIEEDDFGNTEEWNVNKDVENEDDNNKKKKYINIKISYSDELNDLYFNNVINNLYNYIFENKLNNLYINKNHTWFININIYIYEYTPYIYDHICNVINVHLSILLIPFCFYDFDSKWYRCVENYDEFLKLINRTNNIKDNDEKTNNKTVDNEKNQNKIIQESQDASTEDLILVLDKHEQNKNIIINQLNNTNFDLFVQVKNIKTTGMFKRLFINFIPIIKTVNVNDQFIYIVKFVDYSSFFLSTQNNVNNNIIYNKIVQNHNFLNFNKSTIFNSTDNNLNDSENKFEFLDNYYILFNGNHSNIDEASILLDSKSTIRFYYDFIIKFSQKRLDHYLLQN